MTYFLDAPTTPAPRRNPDLKLSDNWSGLWAAVEQGWQAADVGAQRSRQVVEVWEGHLYKPCDFEIVSQHFRTAPATSPMHYLEQSGFIRK